MSGVLGGREGGRGVGPCECVLLGCYHLQHAGSRGPPPCLCGCALLCRFKPGSEIDIGMRVRLVDGDVLVADSETDGGFQGACKIFKQWTRAKYFGSSDGGAAVAQE